MQGVILKIEWCFVLGFRATLGLACTGKNRFDDLFAQHEQRSHGTQSIGKSLVASRIADGADPVLAAEFLQIV